MSTYDANYYASYSVPYGRSAHWLKFFGNVARGIVGECNPATALDAGCAFGLLVESLRAMGVDAVGVDISEYAISQAHESVKDYVGVGDITSLSFAGRVDVVSCIEVLEHLTPDDGARAIEATTRITDTVLFSSTSSDVDEPTHINVQPDWYWRELFARFGFVPDASKQASFVSYDAVWFVRK